MNRSFLPITMEDLTEDWRKWINDSSLQSALRFGQYVLNKRLARGVSWPECYYANTEQAWGMLFDWINGNDQLKTQPRVLIH